MTGDVAEPPAAPGISGLGPAGTTSTARIYNYLLGGKDNNAADRQAAEQLLRALPDAGLVAKANRAFMAAAVRRVAANGVTQFLDIGPGFPATPNVHESARSAAPGARVAYVDHDQEVVARTRELLADDDLVTAFSGDAGDIGAILADPQLGSLIDLAEPVCVLFVSVLHFVAPAQADATVAAVRERIAPGSYLVISAGCNNEQNEPAQGLVQAAYSSGTLLAGRPAAEVAAYFGDFQLLPPGLVQVTDWPNGPAAGSRKLMMADMLAGVARKPG
ncbi:MAG TPA: SAM-dependent methyltransferase [Streptosporangiaceae bacterium]